MSRHEHRVGTRTQSLETSIMDLSDQGYGPKAIAEILGEPLGNVKRVHGYMTESTTERTFRRVTEASSAALLAAIRATGRTFA